MDIQKILNMLIFIIFLVGCATCLYLSYIGCKKIIKYCSKSNDN